MQNADTAQAEAGGAGGAAPATASTINRGERSEHRIQANRKNGHGVVCACACGGARVRLGTREP